jgi:hypothetical protein
VLPREELLRVEELFVAGAGDRLAELGRLQQL